MPATDEKRESYKHGFGDGFIAAVLLGWIIYAVMLVF
jgi:hypothetical protein